MSNKGPVQASGEASLFSVEQKPSKFYREAVNRGTNPPFNWPELYGGFGFYSASVHPEESGEGNKDVEEDGGSAARMKINGSLG